MSIIEIKTKSQFDEIKSNGVVCVDFWAPWCGPCVAFAPTFQAAAEQMHNITFVKVNVDECSEIASEYSIKSIPSIIIFKDNKITYIQAGSMNLADFTDLLEKHS